MNNSGTIDILNDDRELITINRSDLPINISDDILYGFVKHFNAGFDHYDFNHILHELYPNHGNENVDKKKGKGIEYS